MSGVRGLSTRLELHVGLEHSSEVSFSPKHGSLNLQLGDIPWPVTDIYIFYAIEHLEHLAMQLREAACAIEDHLLGIHTDAEGEGHGTDQPV